MTRIKVLFLSPLFLLAFALPAPTQHLWWSPTVFKGKKAEKIEKMTFLYGEIQVLLSGPTIYYCGVNWQPGRPAGGYCGIQDHGKGKRWTIFSVWDTSMEKHPKVISWDKGTAHNRFGGEGEGAHTHYVFPWKEIQTVQFAVTKKTGDNDANTQVTFFFYDAFRKKWIRQAIISSPESKIPSVRWFGGSMNSFLENWSGRKRKAPKICLYRLWAGTSAKDLHFLRRAKGDGQWGILRGSYFLAAGKGKALDKILSGRAGTGGRALIGGKGASLPLLKDRKLPRRLVKQLELLEKQGELALPDLLTYMGPVIKEEKYTVWGACPVMDDNEKVHLFAARWLEPNVDPAWRKSSEIAHYVAGSPEGPFQFVEVVVKGTERKGEWDAFAPSNPEIKRFGNTYALVYIANSDFHRPPHPLNQSIGMMTATSPYGPWKKVGLILDDKKGHFSEGRQVVNPAIIKVGKRFFLYYKTATKSKGRWRTVFGLAIADKLEGPYIHQPKPVTAKGIVIEDAAVFKWKGKIRLLTTDNHGMVTHERGALVLWTSDDGIHFSKKKARLAMHCFPHYLPAYDRKKVKRVYGNAPKAERPKVLMLEGKPAYLYTASGWIYDGSKRCENHLFKINTP